MSTHSVVTLTLNPALDLCSSVDQVVAEHKLRCSAPSRAPGGGGVNVARGLTRLGVDALALWSAGGPTGAALGARLEQEGVHHQAVPIHEETRENLTILETRSGQQYRFGMPGPGLSPSEYRDWQMRVVRLASASPRFLVMSGSLPPGAAPDFYAQLAREAPSGTRVIVDTEEKALAAILDVGVFMVKPNLRELSLLTGRELMGDDDIEQAARSLVQRGCAELVAVSLGRAGAMLVGERISERVYAPLVRTQSTIGAGDSMVAGIVAALVRGLALRDALTLGVACGTAATLQPGTELFQRVDVERLELEIKRTAQGTRT